MKRIVIVTDRNGRVLHVGTEEPTQVLVVTWGEHHDLRPAQVVLPVSMDKATREVLEESPAWVNLPEEIEMDPAWIAEVWRRQTILPQRAQAPDEFFG